MLKVKNRGFTLIELLVVVSIISLLSSIILASVSSARVRANESALSSNLKQLELAILLFNDNNANYLFKDGLYPGGGTFGCEVGEVESGYCSINKHSYLLNNTLVPDYISSIDFITKNISTDPVYQVFYVFDFNLGFFSSGTYNCGGQILTKYVLLYPKYDASGNPIKLSLPTGNGGPGSSYCFGE